MLKAKIKQAAQAILDARALYPDSSLADHDQLTMPSELCKVHQNKERRVRTRRLCTEAGILEHYVPELKTMDERNTSDFIRLIACSEVAKKFLRMSGLRNDEVPTGRAC